MHRTTLEARRHVRGEDHGRARGRVQTLLCCIRCDVFGATPGQSPLDSVRAQYGAWSEPARLSESCTPRRSPHSALAVGAGTRGARRPVV